MEISLAVYQTFYIPMNFSAFHCSIKYFKTVIVLNFFSQCALFEKFPEKFIQMTDVT